MFYLSIDLEGMSGFVTGDDTDTNAQILREHILACVNGIRFAANTTIRAKSFHGQLPSSLPSCVEPVYSTSAEDFDLPKMDPECKGLFLLGFHGLEPECGHGHSYRWPHLFLNGRRVGEITVQMMLAASLGVPVCFIAGDAFALREAKTLVPGITPVYLRPGREKDEGSMDESSLLEIADAAQRAASRERLSPLFLPDSFELGVPMRKSEHADRAEKLPFPIKRDNNTVYCKFDTFPKAYRFLMVDLWQACEG